MTPRHIPPVIRRIARRLPSGVLCTLLLLTSLEATVADVHDGDASAAEVAEAGPAPADCAMSRSAPAADEHDRPGHATHVCHAGHAHVVWVGSADPALAIAAARTGTRDTDVSTLIDLHLTPHVPPPIA